MKDLGDYSCGPWGSFRNMAADMLGAWVWHGERDSAGMPCRFRMTYVCPCTAFLKVEPQLWMDKTAEQQRWQLDWSAAVDDDCPRCGVTCAPVETEDLLLDPEMCPVSEED